MICPYFQKKIEQIEQYTYAYDEDKSVETFREHKLVEDREFGECAEKNCGAFYKDSTDTKARCHYNG